MAIGKQQAPLADSASLALAKESGEIELRGTARVLSIAMLAAWSLFQLYLSSGLGPILAVRLGFGIVNDIHARAIHVAFGVSLCFLLFAGGRQPTGPRRVPLHDYALSFTIILACFWQATFFSEIIGTTGATRPLSVPFIGEIPFEFILGWVAIAIILEAARRAVGLPLAIIGLFFIIYSLYNNNLPEPFGLSKVSPLRYVTTQGYGQEGIFGIPVGVSVKTIFLFVLFGALLDKGGAGKWFIDIAFASVGHMRGGPAKSAVLASGMTGMISGSSIANTVTTGTFTIPIMKKNGYPAVKAGAIEVASSVNGQIMPPIMGAAAFVMAEILGIPYFDVVKHAFIPAIISYIALFYIVHLEALKLGIMPTGRATRALVLLKDGWHYLIPIVVLIFSLTVMLKSPDRAVFFSILTLLAVFLAEYLLEEWRAKSKSFVQLSVRRTAVVIWEGLLSGARNMITVSIAVAAAGLVMGSIGASGLSNALQEILTATAGDNIFLILIATAILSIILGMGLPTTANYLIVSTLMVGIVANSGLAAGFEFPLIAIHLFCFYFGLMADVTPPVGLASYAAASISRADPIRTGIQAFWYSSRTAILPFVFLFNAELLLIGVTSWFTGILVFAMSLLAVLAFTAMSQGYMRVKLNIAEFVLLAIATIILFVPELLLNQVVPEIRNSVAIERFEEGVDESRVTLNIITAFDDERAVTIDREDVGGAAISWDALGVVARPSLLRDRGLQLSLRQFSGPGAKAGLSNGMTVLDATSTQERISKHWFYLPGVLILMLVFLWQGYRERAGLPEKARPDNG
ncbi:MAG: TRAP transporter fused permease subunit [Paracoccaceae bacterium]